MKLAFALFSTLLAGLLLFAPDQQAPHVHGGALFSKSLVSRGESRVPDLVWPLGRTDGDRVFVQLGPDTDPASGSWADWECQTQFTYDGHRGTDVMAFNFRIMDQGVPVLAAADGRVSWTQTGNFDRNYWTPYVGLPNGINIRHGDGSDSQYFHLRKNSVSVVVGDVVEAGQIIGYVGSSGSSPNPHLHFELWQNGQTQDPNRGPCNNRLSLWTDPVAHPSVRPLTILDWDIFLDTDLAGAENNNYLGDHRLKNRPFRPLSVARETATLGVWVQLQGLVGQTYHLRVLDPSGKEFDSLEKGVVFPRSVQWHANYFDFGARVTTMESPEGTWTIELVQEGLPVRRTQFELTTETVFPLRFYPLAGKSIWKEGGTIRDTLSVRSAQGAVTFEVLGAPAGVSVVDREVIIDGNAGFTHRNAEFQVVATDEAGRRDTMYYHIVSPGKPLAGAVGVATSAQSPTELPEPGRLRLFPNPTQGQGMNLQFALPTSGRGRVEIFDMLGRSQGEVDLGRLPAGEQVLTHHLQELPAGVYVLRLQAGSWSAVETLILR